MAFRPFADAVASYDTARIVLFGVPFDRTCSFRGGSRWAPDAIREASYNVETYMMDHGRDILEVKFHDLGNLEEFATTTDMVKSVSETSGKIANAGKIPIAIGGEHSIAPAVVRGLPKDVGVIGLDAHLDFRDSYSDDKWSHACSQRRIGEHVRVLPAVGREKVPLTIDTDVIAPAFAPAVGNPEPFGLTPLQVKAVVDALGPKLVGMDINEVSPAWDHGQTALLAARFVRETIMAIAGPGD